MGSVAPSRVYRASGTRGVGGSSSAPVVAVPDDSAGGVALSFGDFPHAIPCDPHRFRALFPALWSKFCRAHFRDPMHVAFGLGVTERTGRDWWEGKTGASGSAALYAVGTVPGAMGWIINEVRKVA
jgi:hypothetical protein